MIYCGDFCSPFVPPKLASVGVPIYACLGNNDEDQIGLFKKGGKLFEWTFLAQEFGTVVLGKRRIAFCHYPELAEFLAKSGKYDAVFHGHTHVSRNEKHGKSLLLNPGAICGIQKGKSGTPSYAIYDTKTNSAEVIEINPDNSNDQKRQIAKEKAVLLALQKGMALSRRGLQIHGVRKDGSSKLLSESDNYENLWQDVLKELKKDDK